MTTPASRTRRAEFAGYFAIFLVDNNNNGRFSLRQFIQFIQAQCIFMQRFGLSSQGVVGAKFNTIALQRSEPIFRDNCL